MTRLRHATVLLAGCAIVGLLAGCATETDAGAAPDAPVGHSLGSLAPGLPDGEVIAEGTVLEDSDGARVCFAVMESYPPQCHGLPLTGWSWEGLDGAESANGVTWGAYAVQGTYDGESLTVTQPPVLLALYDPMMREDPTGGEPGDTDAATLQRIEEELPERLGDELLSWWPQEGRMWAQVVWDDGTWQDAADADYGDGTVVIQPWLHELG